LSHGLWAGRSASERLIRYYSYLFTFPSVEAMITTAAVISAVGCASAFAMTWGAPSITRGLLYGLLGLTAPLLASDALAASLFRGGRFLTPRRFTILSYVSCIIYVAVALLSSFMGALTGRADLLARGVLLAVAVNAALRHLTLAVFSTRGPGKNLLATFTQPVLCFAAAVVLLPAPWPRMSILGAAAAAIMVGGMQLLLWVMGRWEDEHRGLRLMSLFRSFILAWAENLNEPLEAQITRFGEVRDLLIDSLVYGDADGRCRAALIVPYVHPGPFRNVGSSALPQMIVERVGAKLGCPVLVSHGISTHERDLTRSGEAWGVADSVASDLPSGEAEALASPIVWVERQGAQASCQMFGGVALVTLTMSPKSCDDLPEELGNRIMEAAEAMDVTAVVVDSHNSLQQRDELNDSDVDALFHAAVEAMRRAKEAPRHAFSVGAARVVPPDWGLEDGMGPCGVSALAVRLEDGQTCAYVVVDGNNMMSGLRERMVSALKSRGVDEVEVMTTDTHLVNAIGATTRGYYPIGERTDEQKMIEYVVKAFEAAVSRLERCHAYHTRTTLPGLTVLGEAGLNLLGDVLESAFSLFKRTATVAVPASLLLAAAVVFLL